MSSALVDWSGYTTETTLADAFKMAGLVLAKTETPGFFRVHRPLRPERLIGGYPKSLYRWLHENYGCPCDAYWLD